MKNRLLHTPEGVRDIYGEELLRKKDLERTLGELVRSYGYNEIETPAFEYFDIFQGKTGTTPSREIYKFFDSENNTLALRPDFTPGAARAAAKYFLEEGTPVRLSYLGKTFSNRSDLQGKLKEVTELGLEYMGEPSVDADAEIINISVELLKAAGLKDFQICIGNVEYFKGLCEAAGLDGERAADLTDSIRSKNYFGTMDALEGEDISEDVRETLRSFPDFFGNISILDEAESRVKDIKRSSDAVLRLKELYRKLEAYGVSDHITFDLGMLSKHDYYTGIIFRAYTFGTGDAIVRGGRYDNLLSNFGKDAAAVGFTVVMDKLMMVQSRQKIDVPEVRDRTLVIYHDADFSEALKKCRELRADGELVEMTRIERDADILAFKSKAGREGLNKVILINNGKAEVL